MVLVWILFVRAALVIVAYVCLIVADVLEKETQMMSPS